MKLFNKIDEWFDRPMSFDIDGYRNIQTNTFTILLVILTLMAISMKLHEIL